MPLHWRRVEKLWRWDLELSGWVGEVKHKRFESSGVAQMMMMVMMLPFEEILSKAEKVKAAQKWDFSKHLTCSCQQTLFRAPASAVSKLTECMCGNVKLANSCGCAIHLSKWAIHLLIMATCLWVIKMITMVLSGRARWWLEWWPRADADARWSSIAGGYIICTTVWF